MSLKEKSKERPVNLLEKDPTGIIEGIRVETKKLSAKEAEKTEEIKEVLADVVGLDDDEIPQEKVQENIDRLGQIEVKKQESEDARLAALGGVFAIENPELAGAVHEWYSDDSHEHESGESESLEDGSVGYENPEDRDVAMEKIRDHLIGHVGSDEYLEKLTIEFNGNADSAKKEQEKRLELLKTFEANVNLGRGRDSLRQFFDSISSDPDASPEKREKMFQIFERKYKSKNVAGLYDTAGEKVYIFEDQDAEGEFEEATRHEVLHASTKGNEGIPERTKKILDETFVPDIKSLGSSKAQKMNEYLRDSSERLVRKQKLDLQLQEYGIKEYGEEFTEEHLKAVALLYSAGLLEGDVRQFVETTQFDLESYKKIFNEIAVADPDERGLDLAA